MKPLRNRGRALLVTGVVIVLLYILVPFPFLTKTGESDIQEACIRWLVGDNHSAVRGELKVCYIGLGTTFDHSDKDFSPHDPPAEFLRRFEDLRIPVKVVSEAKSKDGQITDDSGRPSLCISAGNVRRLSLGLVRCRAMYFEGGLSSAGYEVYILRLPFTWVPFRAKTLWIS
jgi:hypothetical protein